MKFLATFGVILFLLFAAVQYNDPDPYIWIPVYLIPVFFSLQILRGKYYFSFMLVATVFYLSFSIATFPPALLDWIQDELNNKSMSMKTPSMEEARESLGSLICAGFLAFYCAYYYLKVRVPSEIS